MAASFILHEETIRFEVSVLSDIPCKAAIDRGLAQTKIVFLPKTTEACGDVLEFRCATFSNEHFLDAVRFLKEEAQLPEAGGLHVTGRGIKLLAEKMKEILGRDVVFVDKKQIKGFGAFLFVNHCKEKDMFYPTPEYKKWVVESNMVNLLTKDVKSSDTGDKPFPAFVVHVGSNSRAISVNEDGESSVIADFALSSRSFSGLSHALIGTSNYNEILKLAEGGDYRKVDTTVKDLTNEDPDCPYGAFPQDMPLVAFGKLSEASWDKNSTQTEDLAAGLVRLAVIDICSFLFLKIVKMKIKKLYVTGSFFNHELVRKIFYESTFRYFRNMDFEMHILRPPFISAFAAMLMNPTHESN